MKKKNHIIWSNMNLDLDDWKEDILEENPDAGEDELYKIICETNSRYLEDERPNLNKDIGAGILVIADLGLWYGRRSGYSIHERGNISHCLYSSHDFAEWYVDGNGDLRGTAVHHDGTNHYLYRAVKPEVTREQLDRLCDKILAGEHTSKDISRYTYRLGDIIADVYGFKVGGRRSKYVA